MRLCFSIRKEGCNTSVTLQNPPTLLYHVKAENKEINTDTNGLRSRVFPRSLYPDPPLLIITLSPLFSYCHPDPPLFPCHPESAPLLLCHPDPHLFPCHPEEPKATKDLSTVDSSSVRQLAERTQNDTLFVILLHPLSYCHRDSLLSSL